MLRSIGDANDPLFELHARDRRLGQVCEVTHVRSSTWRAVQLAEPDNTSPARLNLSPNRQRRLHGPVECALQFRDDLFSAIHIREFGYRPCGSKVDPRLARKVTVGHPGPTTRASRRLDQVPSGVQRSVKQSSIAVDANLHGLPFANALQLAFCSRDGDHGRGPLMPTRRHREIIDPSEVGGLATALRMEQILRGHDPRSAIGPPCCHNPSLRLKPIRVSKVQVGHGVLGGGIF